MEVCYSSAFKEMVREHHAEQQPVCPPLHVSLCWFKIQRCVQRIMGAMIQPTGVGKWFSFMKLEGRLGISQKFERGIGPVQGDASCNGIQDGGPSEIKVDQSMGIAIVAVLLAGAAAMRIRLHVWHGGVLRIIED